MSRRSQPVCKPPATAGPNFDDDDGDDDESPLPVWSLIAAWTQHAWVSGCSAYYARLQMPGFTMPGFTWLYMDSKGFKRPSKYMSLTSMACICSSALFHFRPWAYSARSFICNRCVTESVMFAVWPQKECYVCGITACGFTAESVVIGYPTD